MIRVIFQLSGLVWEFKLTNACKTLDSLQFLAHSKHLNENYLETPVLQITSLKTGSLISKPRKQWRPLSGNIWFPNQVMDHVRNPGHSEQTCWSARDRAHTQLTLNMHLWYSSPPFNGGYDDPKSPADGRNRKYRTPNIVLFSIYMHTFTLKGSTLQHLFSISESPAPLLLHLGPLLSKIKVTSKQALQYWDHQSANPDGY